LTVLSTPERTAYRACQLGDCCAARTRTCRSRSSRGGKPTFRAPSREVVHWSRTEQGWHWLLVNRATISGAAVGEEVGYLADLSLGAGDLLAIEVDVEVVSVEAFVAAVLAGGVARQRSGDGDLMFSGGLF